MSEPTPDMSIVEVGCEEVSAQNKDDTLHEPPRKRRRWEDELTVYNGCPTFIDPPPPNLSCAICSGVFSMPVIVNGCGHEFCEGCIKSAVAINPECPVCRQKINKPDFYTPLLRLREDIGQLKVYCPYNSNDMCKSELKLADLETHLKICEYAVMDCPNAPHGCGWRGRRYDLPTHNKTCPFEHLKPLITKITTENSAIRQENAQLIHRLEACQNNYRVLLEKCDQMQSDIKKAKCFETVIKSRADRQRRLFARRNGRELSSSHEHDVLNVRVAENNLFQWVFKMKATTRLGKIQEIIQDKRKVPILLTCDGPLHYGGQIVEPGNSLHELGIEVGADQGITLYAEHVAGC